MWTTVWQYFCLAAWLTASVYFLFASPIIGIGLLLWLAASVVWDIYGPLVKFSFREWSRKTKARMDAAANGKAEVIDLLEEYKARKRSGN